jgi:[ribosomal protein S5]-alanine N-acetyltransferase
MLPLLTTERLTIAHMALPHAPLLAEFFRRNENHLAPWDPPRPTTIRELEYWESECARAADEYLEGAVVRWVLLLNDAPAQLVGRINYTQIARGPFQSCMLGYALDARYEGRGLMTEALRATNQHAFDVLRLHRIQANHLPNNVRSSRLLQRLGFRREGLAQDYLYIADKWRDHVLTALINPRFDSSIFTRSGAA